MELKVKVSGETYTRNWPCLRRHIFQESNEAIYVDHLVTISVK